MSARTSWLPRLDGVRDADVHLLALVFLFDLSADFTTARPPAPARWETIGTVPDAQLGASLDAACSACLDTWGEAIEGFFDRVAFANVSPQALRVAMRSVECLRPQAGAYLGARTHLGDIYQETRSQGVLDAQGAFFTPYHVASLMAEISGVGPGETVHDPACGAGNMLIAALDVARATHGDAAAETVTLIGIELDPRTASVGRANLLLAGAHPDQFWIGAGDALMQPLVARDPADGRLKALSATSGSGPVLGDAVLLRDGIAPLIVPDRVLYRPQIAARTR